MTIDQIIALSASVGAFLAAIATFLTVRQMIQQREASYRPELVISRTFFEGSKDPIAKGELPTHWVTKPVANGESDSWPVFSVPLVNLGLGAAKSLAVRWSFPIEEMIEKVNDLAQRTLTPAYFDLKDGAMSIKSESLGNGTSIWRNQQQDSFDYVLPVAVSNAFCQLRLPLVFIQLSAAYLYLSAKDKDRKSIPDILPLRAHLEYLDIGDKQHSADFDISIHIIIFAGDGSFVNGYAESKKCA